MCPYAHSRVKALRKLSQRRLRRSLELQALHYKEGSSSVEREDSERERGKMGKRLLIDRQETQLAVLGTQVGVFIYIQGEAPIRGCT